MSYQHYTTCHFLNIQEGLQDFVYVVFLPEPLSSPPAPKFTPFVLANLSNLCFDIFFSKEAEPPHCTPSQDWATRPS